MKEVKRKIEKELKQTLGNDSIFEYKSVLNYFLTIFFIFLLMIILLLIVALSREVLADKGVEQHLLDTRSLLQELEEVEQNQNQFVNISRNISDYKKDSILTRLDLGDIDHSTRNRANNTFVSFKTQHVFQTIDGGTIIVKDLFPQINDRVIVKLNEQYVEGAVIEVKDSGNLVLLHDFELTGIGEISEVDFSNFQGVILYKGEE